MLHLLKTNRSMSTAQLAGQLGMTEMGVRRHLHLLIDQQAVEVEFIRQSVGRPMQLFRLSQSGDEQFPKHYHQLVLDLLGEVESWNDGEQGAVQRLFESRQRTMRERYESRMTNKSLHERISELGMIQDSNGYMVETVQQEDGSWLLHEYNCPIAQVAKRYEEPCRCELVLFQELLGTTAVERTECLAQQGMRCTYHIKQEAVPSDR